MHKHFFLKLKTLLIFTFLGISYETLCQFLNWVLNSNDMNNVHRQREVLLKSEKNPQEKKEKENEGLLSIGYIFVSF